MTLGCIPPVAVSCGDPAGIGLEIVLAAWKATDGEVPFFLICDPSHYSAGTPLSIVESPREVIDASTHGLPILPHVFNAHNHPGHPAPENASDVVEVIRRSVDLTMTGEASAVCTAPIAKNVLADHGGFEFPGHTEYLAALAGIQHPVMMLVSDELKVVPATIHIPLSQVTGQLTAPHLEQVIRTTAAALKDDFGIPTPCIAVAGLNPHAGESGMLGSEEVELIKPLCDVLRAEGLNLIGPLSADTMFHAEARAGYDAAIAMYHDQALIPIKTLAFDRGVNVTLGLPFVRTSPDHGTAFDIAGRGLASPASMIEALRMAWRIAKLRHRNKELKA